MFSEIGKTKVLHRIILHLPPGYSFAMPPVLRVEVAEHVGRGRREDPAGEAGEGLVQDVTRTVDVLARHLGISHISIETQIKTVYRPTASHP